MSDKVYCVQDFLNKNNFFVRPDAGEGLWILFLLPLSLIVTLIRHSIIATTTYKLATLVSFSLSCSSLYIIIKCYKNERLKVLNVWSIIIALGTGYLLVLFQKTWIFAISSGLFIIFFYLKLYAFLLMDLKESFTLGEAGIIAQGITLFFYCTIVNIITFGIGKANLKSNVQISTLIIQIGLMGLMTLALALHKFKIRKAKTFYITTGIVLLLMIILPLHTFLNQSPVWWILSQILGDIVLLKLFLYWICCTCVAILAVSNQIYYAKKASTGTRKIFHILAVLVFVPGLYFRCSFLYLASGVTLGIFFALEILRLLLIPPLGSQLQDGFTVFKDEKDTGSLALTPIYLLVGVSLPIWIHPSPCDLTDSAQFAILPLLSGILSIGLGDTAASYIGSNFGRLKWQNSTKTVEGTLACIFSQLSFVYFLYYLGLLSYLTSEHITRIIIAVVVGSIVEAKTTQIDNLVLPFVMYLILI